MKLSAIVPSRLQVNPVSEQGNLYLDLALMSLRRQSRQVDECIVAVDPGQADKVPARFERTGWLKIVEAKEPSQASALNAAVEASTGDVLVFLEDDDQREPNAVAIAVDAMTSTGAVLVSSNQREVDESGAFLRINDFATPSGWTLMRSWFDKAGGFDTSYRWHLDNAFLGSLMAKLAAEYANPQDKRVHLVEAGAMKTMDPTRKAWIGNVHRRSALGETTQPEPLITRIVHAGSGMHRIATDPAVAAESFDEMKRLVATYGGVPW